MEKRWGFTDSDRVFAAGCSLAVIDFAIGIAACWWIGLWGMLVFMFAAILSVLALTKIKP